MTSDVRTAKEWVQRTSTKKLHFLFGNAVFVLSVAHQITEDLLRKLHVHFV